MYANIIRPNEYAVLMEKYINIYDNNKLTRKIRIPKSLNQFQIKNLYYLIEQHNIKIKNND